jgi:hypothetical protein
MESRSTRSSWRDTNPHPSRGSLSGSRSLDVLRQLSTRNDQTHTTQNAGNEMVSSSGYDRAYNTYNVKQSYSGDLSHAHKASNEMISSSGYDRTYSTYDVTQDYSGDLPHAHMVGQSSTGYTEWPTGDAADQGSAGSGSPPQDTTSSSRASSSNAKPFANVRDSLTLPYLDKIPRLRKPQTFASLDTQRAPSSDAKPSANIRDSLTLPYLDKIPRLRKPQS